MLNLTHWFSRGSERDTASKSTHDTAPEADTLPMFDDLDGIQVVSDQQGISQRFREALTCMAPVQIWALGCSAWSTAAVVRVNYHDQRIVISATMDEALFAGQALNFSFRRGGRVSLGGCHVISVPQKPGPEANEYVLSWPKFLIVHDERQSPRLHAIPHCKAWQQLLAFLGCPGSETIYDVGEGGIGLRVDRAQINGLSIGSRITLRQIIPTCSAIPEIELQVAYLSCDPQGHCLLGARFEGMSEGWQRDLRRALLKLQAGVVSF